MVQERPWGVPSRRGGIRSRSWAPATSNLPRPRASGPRESGEMSAYGRPLSSYRQPAKRKRAEAGAPWSPLRCRAGDDLVGCRCPAGFEHQPCASSSRAGKGLPASSEHLPRVPRWPRRRAAAAAVRRAGEEGAAAPLLPALEVAVCCGGLTADWPGRSWVAVHRDATSSSRARAHSRARRSRKTRSRPSASAARLLTFCEPGTTRRGARSSPPCGPGARWRRPRRSSRARVGTAPDEHHVDRMPEQGLGPGAGPCSGRGPIQCRPTPPGVSDGPRIRHLAADRRGHGRVGSET